MKILLIFFIFVMFLGTIFIVNSDALVGPAAPRDDPSIKEISLQIQVRNSDGVLFAYMEPTIFWLSNVGLIHELLDAEEKKTIITIDGKSYEQIEFEIKQEYTNEGQMASFVLGWKELVVLAAEHNGFIGKPGDTITTSWKIIRPIQ